MDQQDQFCLRYRYPEDRIFNRVISDIPIALGETTLTILDSIETSSPVKREIVRVVSLSITEITELTTRPSGSVYLEPLPNDKILDWSKFKAFAGNNLNMNRILKFASGPVEKIAGKRESVGYQHFLLFPQWSLEVEIVWERLKQPSESWGRFVLWYA